MKDALSILRDHGIHPTSQRTAVAQYVLNAHEHPTADDVWRKVRRVSPTVSRATVYNTLNLLVEKGLLHMKTLKGGTVVFDPRVEPHHHFIDEETGVIYDVPWSAVRVTGHRSLRGFDVHEHQVVMKGRKKR